MWHVLSPFTRLPSYSKKSSMFMTAAAKCSLALSVLSEMFSIKATRLGSSCRRLISLKRNLIFISISIVVVFVCCQSRDPEFILASQQQQHGCVGSHGHIAQALFRAFLSLHTSNVIYYLLFLIVITFLLFPPHFVLSIEHFLVWYLRLSSIITKKKSWIIQKKSE